MRRIALIVEGHGECETLPGLISRIGGLIGEHVIGPNPIRCGGYPKLNRSGELERFVTMAATRDDIDSVLVLLDLEDDCPVQVHKNFLERSKPITDRYGKDISICLAYREFETWFLHDLPALKTSCTDYVWTEIICENPESRRGGKEQIALAIGRRYRETVDQKILSKAMNIDNVFKKSRSFRKFAKEVSGLSYQDLQNFF